MPLQARRVCRWSLTVAVSLALGYGLAVDLPFLAPIFAMVLTSTPAPPRGAKALLILVVALALTMGIGLMLIPALINYQFPAVLLVGTGVYIANRMAVNLGKGQVAMLLTMSLTMISAAGTLDWSLAVMVINAMILGIVIAVVSSWVVYPFFPEDPAVLTPSAPSATPAVATGDNWIALRATLVVMPVYLLALTDPAAYLAVIMKSVSLGQQSSTVDLKRAGRELLGSTFAGGCLAIALWFALGLSVTLWMFFLWMLLFGLYLSSKLYQVSATRLPASFWSNTAITLLILLGSAVQDSASGKDVYQAFAVRMALFLAVTIYAWLAMTLLEAFRPEPQPLSASA